MSGSIIAQRLRDECGVEFLNGVPTRALHMRHGELSSTFLVLEEGGRHRVRLNDCVTWRWRGRKGMRISLRDGLSARKLARVPELRIEVEDAELVVSAGGF